MFILEEPYVSDFMVETLEENQYQVLNNQVARSLSSKFNFVDEISNKVYSNSENSIDFVLGNSEESDLAEIINICKDKYEFRNRLMNIYPDFFFEEVLLEDLDDLDITEFPMPFIIKPTVGFLSMGVHKVNSIDEWENVLMTIKEEVKSFKSFFPDRVLSSSGFIIEDVIDGDEFAIDAYFNESGEAAIMNIFQHPFVSAGDVSDRMYLTSKKIIQDNLKDFENLLSLIGETLNIKNFPMHMEVRKSKSGQIIPIEINPMRFAGWCTTDTAYYAYGINMYECFENQTKPDWDKILSAKGDEIYYFAMAETPSNIDKSNIDFDYEGFKKNFSNILEFRKINYVEKPLFAILFGSVSDEEEITKILQLKTEDYVKILVK